MPSLQKFKADGDRFVVTEKNRPYGMITGTTLAGLLGYSKWSSPFTVTARMLRLFNEDISKKREVHAGVVIEPKILDYLGAIHGDDMYGERKGDHEDWKSDFEHPIFGGHIDGMMPDGSIVEVKTTRNPEDWLNGPPTYYWIQASLYAHFLNADKIVFAVGFTDEKTLSDPSSFDANEKTVAVISVPIIPSFDLMLEAAVNLYNDTIAQNRTAEYNPTNPMDVRTYNLIKSQLWDDDELSHNLDVLKEEQDRLDRIKDMESDIQDIKDMVTLHMKYNDLDVKDVGGRTVTLLRYKRSSIDTESLKRDGLYEIYTKTNEIESLRIKGGR